MNNNKKWEHQNLSTNFKAQWMVESKKLLDHNLLDGSIIQS